MIEESDTYHPRIGLALKEFAVKCPKLPKDAKGYGYSYCPFPTMMGIINPILDELGLHIQQTTVVIEGKVYMSTKVFDSYGDCIESLCPMVIQGTPPTPKQVSSGVFGPGQMVPPGMQQVGATITYARRYGIGMALNLVTDDDSDCAVVRISRYDFKCLINALDTIADRDKVVLKIFEEFGIDALENLPAGVFADVMERIKKKREQDGRRDQ